MKTKLLISILLFLNSFSFAQIKCGTYYNEYVFDYDYYKFTSDSIVTFSVNSGGGITYTLKGTGTYNIKDSLLIIKTRYDSTIQHPYYKIISNAVDSDKACFSIKYFDDKSVDFAYVYLINNGIVETSNFRKDIEHYDNNTYKVRGHLNDTVLIMPYLYKLYIPFKDIVGKQLEIFFPDYFISENDTINFKFSVNNRYLYIYQGGCDQIKIKKRKERKLKKRPWIKPFINYSSYPKSFYRTEE